MSSTTLEQATAETVAQDDATLTVVVERATSNWCAYTPDDIGVVVATGPTREATIDNFRSALKSHFQFMRDEGLLVPHVSRLEIRETVTA
ncbi:MAG: hypothetical protein M3Y28_01575 [Armatimonadota bacterium]|nr:hypothetical protein [Armatimonadota bacterium]